MMECVRLEIGKKKWMEDETVKKGENEAGREGVNWQSKMEVSKRWVKLEDREIERQKKTERENKRQRPAEVERDRLKDPENPVWNTVS